MVDEGKKSDEEIRRGNEVRLTLGQIVGMGHRRNVGEGQGQESFCDPG